MKNVCNNSFNTRYKTVLCRHFMEGDCPKGPACQFAHGEQELRRRDEQLPVEAQLRMMKVPYNNYKTQMCRFFQTNGFCQYGKNCTYAHGPEELRQPYEELPKDVNPSF